MKVHFACIRRVLVTFTLTPIGTIGFVGATVGCGGAKSSASSTSDVTMACGNYFDAVYGSKCDPARPSSEVSRDRGRFLSLCEATLALPGLDTALTQLQSCVNVLNASGVCLLSAGTVGAEPLECRNLATGTLGGGAACSSAAQCQSADCVTTSDGGTTSTCGTCAVPIAVGQQCPTAAAGYGCVPGSACSTTSMTCQAIAYGDAGAECGTTTAFCDDGFYCDPTTQLCAANKGAGSACLRGECALPLVCLGTTNLCGNAGGNGAPCAAVQDCAPGFGCTGSTCAPVSYASAGQNCAGMCLVGSCTSSGGAPSTCPTVIPDGQSCTLGSALTTCDMFANCTNGVCTLLPTTCN